MPTTMVQTASDPFDGSRPPVPGGPATPLRLTELASGEHFQRLFERRAARTRQASEWLSAVRLQVKVGAGLSAEWRCAMLADYARRVCRRLRDPDLVTCWDAGTQFGVLLPRCDPLQAERVCERLRRAASGEARLFERPLQLSVMGQVLMPREPGPLQDGG